MKQLHKQASTRRDEEIPMSQTPPYSPKSLKHSRSLRRSLNYLLKEQRLLFILVGILIGSTFFVIQPSLSYLSSASSGPSIPRSHIFSGNRESVSLYDRKGVVGYDQSFKGKYPNGVGRVPVGIRNKRKRIVVTGGAGFVGSHLVDKLIARGDDVIVIDNFFTGRKENIVHLFGNPRFELIRHDVVEPILLEVDQIYHLACPASPVHYKYNPVKTIKTNVMGTLNMLGLAKRIGARFLLTSTSEVYGDPLEHPQKETYWGHVNPIGVRSCYDEGKRTAETLTMDYHRGDGVEVRIARIFNTYGPRMCLDDGRVVSNFVSQAIRKQPMTVYGDGKQTRSFQYVSDLVDGLVALMESEHIGPFNLGNPGEFTMLELAEVVKETIDSSATIEFKENTADDPHKRKPDITKAKDLLNWEPKISLREGLPLMVNDFRNRILNEDEGKGNE
ncbi:UDP-glucuronic acid decarboxylase 1-like [Olea europaea var. sylvestris]|uniref:UDP-glucuronate decarboxylase n=1 Tax=Olea europaea subsp. europaea TaxID=158383 RepID=A0A8S0QS14_OLEEU|nr:UDP-glucuronic acid decarboxylase 1-like [Olea europaea var. sylvestris]CAA2967548.1 UDP-glucuronic acid decarboxylase 1 [Olea europaea subsp. europaea]